MDNSIDIYLHKKFKKQTSIDCRQQQKNNVEKENREECSKNTLGEKTISECTNKDQYAPASIDNNERHSNNSTNEQSLLAVTSSNNLTSSISLKSTLTSTQSSNSCISYIVSPRDHVSPTLRGNHFSETQQTPVETSSHIITTAENVAIRPFNLLDQKDISYNYDKIRYCEDIPNTITDPKADDSGPKSSEAYTKFDDVSAPPDRPPGGKYVCTYCNLSCSKPSVLQKHIRAHTNERPYPCIQCGFSFKTRSNLYKHCRSRTHANRVMGNKNQENGTDVTMDKSCEQMKTNMMNIVEHNDERIEDLKSKPYKPRFHTGEHISGGSLRTESENSYQGEHNVNRHDSEGLSNHINDIIDKNNSIVNPVHLYGLHRQASEAPIEAMSPSKDSHLNIVFSDNSEEPLNLTNKCRKRCVSEVQEPTIQKSLIKELLLKSLYADSNLQCPHCKMIFQTVTEFELHKLRSCKGFTHPGMKYSRSSSVNVASILTHNKNAFDNIPHLQNTVFPMKSPGPFLGKTRLVESERTKSFSFEDVLPDSLGLKSDKYSWPTVDLHTEKEKKHVVKLFGGEVKIANTSGESGSFRLETPNRPDNYNSDVKLNDYTSKLSKNHVVKSGLQSGGTVLTNKTHYNDSLIHEDNVGNIYKTRLDLPVSDSSTPTKTKITFTVSTAKDHQIEMGARPSESSIGLKHLESPSYNYLNITDFSQKAAKLIAPNLKRPNLNVLGVTISTSSISNEDTSLKNLKSAGSDHHMVNGEVQPVRVFTESLEKESLRNLPEPSIIAVNKNNQNLYNPMNLLVNGKIVRYVPGMPGPITTEEPMETPPTKQLPEPSPSVSQKYSHQEPIDNTSQYVSRDQEKCSTQTLKYTIQASKPTSSEIQSSTVKSNVQEPEEKASDIKSTNEAKIQPSKFVRPNSLALKPSAACLKQHHGLTPTMFNQILISPDTPRVAKKYVQQFLHGNYFSYLGLKSSTKPVYCTLNKTQPFYTLHFKKLSMYSEWRQQDNKIDKLFASAYDSRQQQQNYNMAGKVVDLIVHSSYKFILSELHSPNQDKGEETKPNAIMGGYESKEDYTYIRGRGRGRYVCDQCGIRCKKPSMLKKHIRTHSNDRPYTCAHCNFSFKTKGNLTKHMKSKAHTKNTSNNPSNSANQQTFTQSSDSETEDSGMDSSDESTRQQEHEAAYGLLTLSQKSTHNVLPSPQPYTMSSCPLNSANEGVLRSHPLSDVVNIMDTEEIVHVTKINYAKNKILDEQRHFSLPSSKHLGRESMDTSDSNSQSEDTVENSTTGRPLTYPYTSAVFLDGKQNNKNDDSNAEGFSATSPRVSSVDVPQNLSSPTLMFSPSEKLSSNNASDIYDKTTRFGHNLLITAKNKFNMEPYKETEQCSDRKRKIPYDNTYNKDKIQKNEDVIDLSVCATESVPMNVVTHITLPSRLEHRFVEIVTEDVSRVPTVARDSYGGSVLKSVECHQNEFGNNIEISYKEQCVDICPDTISENSNIEYDNSAMETLADVATKQVKLEKNTLAKSVASEYLKLVTKSEYPTHEGVESYNMLKTNKDVNDLIVKPEESKSCTVCSKNFSKSSHLRLHMNIHYLERPFRCDSCSVSFRTKGHLQKHERSASHHNKLTSSPALLSSEPRPFKCLDCNIAFRIHGHLAKHLRSKMHIMKLECLAKIPFGLYAELERSNSLLTEINTVDGDQCLESLKVLAKKVFTNDPSKLNPIESSELIDPDS